MTDARVAGVPQDPLRENPEQQLDLVHPGGVEGREMKPETPTVPLVEGLPDSGAMGVEIVPDDVDGLVGVGLDNTTPPSGALR